MAEYLREQFLLAGLDRRLAAGAGDVVSADVLPAGIVAHG
jgi:hypothetical protein